MIVLAFVEAAVTVAIVLVTTYLVAYSVAVYHNDHWKRRGIPGPKPEPFWGNLKNFLTPDEPDVLQFWKWTKQFGKVYGLQQGWKNLLVISDPEMIHEFMVKKFEIFYGRKTAPISGNVDKNALVHVFNARGARWKRLRTISNPVFTVNNLKKVLPIVDDASRVMMGHLDKAYEKAAPFNIHPYFHELTMDVIARIAMGQKGSRQFENEYTPIAKEVFTGFGSSWFVVYSWVFPFIAPFLRWLSLATSGLRKAPFRVMLDRIAAAVKERKQMRERGEVDPDHSVDFIDLFLDAEAPEVHDQTMTTYDKSDVKVSKKLTTEEIVAQCFVFLLAGFDTTANSLAITCFYLAKHPEKQQRLREEIDEICQDEDVTYEQINRLKYADAVMKEALRLNPIAAFAASRTCSEDTTIGDIKVEKGTIVHADVFAVQYDKSTWGENAEEFEPERWLGDDQHRPQMAWLPFGGGPRTCIGMRLAYLEEKLALVHILRKYNIVQCPETEKELKLVGLTVLNPDSVTIKLQMRDD